MGLENIILIIIQNFTKLIPIRFAIIDSYQQGVKWFLGNPTKKLSSRTGWYWPRFKKKWPFIRFYRTGLHFYWPGLQLITLQDTVPEVVNLPVQSLITMDEVGICVSGAAHYEIVDLHKYYTRVQDFDDSFINMIMGMVERKVTTANFNDIRNGGKKALCEFVMSEAGKIAHRWGVNLIDFYITDMVKARSIRLFGGMPAAEVEAE